MMNLPDDMIGEIRQALATAETMAKEHYPLTEGGLAATRRRFNELAAQPREPGGDPRRDHIPAGEFSNEDLADEVRAAVYRLNELSGEAGKRGLKVEFELDPPVRLQHGDGPDWFGPYVRATVSRVL